MVRPLVPALVILVSCAATSNTCDASSFDCTMPTSDEHSMLQIQRPETRGGREPRPICCEALTADCLACAAQMSWEDYCATNPATSGCEPSPFSVEPRFIRPAGGTAIYWEVSGVKHWVSSCSLCDDSPSPRPCEGWTEVPQSYIDGLETAGGLDGDGSRFECTQHPLYEPLPPLPASGFYRIQQKQGLNYVDAHHQDDGDYDYASWQNDGDHDHFVYYYYSVDYDVVGRTWQDNPSQWWYLNGVGALTDQVYKVQQVGKNDGTASGRFLDVRPQGFFNRVVTRAEQVDGTGPEPCQPPPYSCHPLGHGHGFDSHSQEWHFTWVDTNTFTINHAVNMRFLHQSCGPHEGSDPSCQGSAPNDASIATRPEQGDDSQKWVLTPLSPDMEQHARDLLFP